MGTKNDLDVNAYDFYIKESPSKLLNKGWYSISSEEDILEVVFPIYKDMCKRPSIFCQMVWYGKDEPLRIQIYSNDNIPYTTFLREKYNSSSYINGLHKSILRFINKFNTVAKKKGM